MKRLLSTWTATRPALPRYAPVVNARVRTAALLCAVLLAGCSSESERPTTLPPVSAAPSASASAAASVVPVKAQAETPEGAAAFARFWYEEIGRAFADKDPEIIRRLSAPGCETCGLFVSSLTKLRQNDERTTAVIYDIVFAEAPAIDGSEARVDVVYDSPAIKRYDASGKIIREEPAVEGFAETLVLDRSSGRWLVSEVRAAR